LGASKINDFKEGQPYFGKTKELKKSIMDSSPYYGQVTKTKRPRERPFFLPLFKISAFSP
jgi:hypothetical protein